MREGGKSFGEGVEEHHPERHRREEKTQPVQLPCCADEQQRADGSKAPREFAAQQTGREVAHARARVTRIHFVIQDAIESHGRRSGADHCRHDPPQLPPEVVPRKTQPPQSQQRTGKREWQRENGVLEANHLQGKPQPPHEHRESRIRYHFSSMHLLSFGARALSRRGPLATSFFTVLAVVVALTSCGSSKNTLDDLNTREVTLPNGKVIRAELAIDPVIMQRGLMFRTSLAPDRGMLFIHEKQGRWQYYMFQCFISLDMIWMDNDRRIVEISADTPPCKSKNPSECPVYGGHADSRYVLELAAGQAKANGLKIGDQLSF